MSDVSFIHSATSANASRIQDQMTSMSRTVARLGGLDRALLCQSLTMLPRAMIMSGNTSSCSTSRSPLLTTKKLIRNVRIGTTNGSRSIWYGDIERSDGDWPLAAAPPERMSSPFHTRHITMPPAFDLLLPLAYCMLLTVGWHANEIERPKQAEKTPSFSPTRTHACI